MPSHIGQPVEWIQLAAMDTVFFHCTVEQKAAPSVRQTVIEYAEQAVEDRGVGNGYAGPERKFDRRNLDARSKEGGVILEKDLPVFEREASNLAAPSWLGRARPDRLLSNSVGLYAMAASFSARCSAPPRRRGQQGVERLSG